MKMQRLLQWAAVLALAVAPVANRADAQETGTVTLHGTFKMDAMWYTVGADLAAVFANGNAHTWTLTMRGTTYTRGGTYPDCTTVLTATTSELRFEGPDAETLNQVVGVPLAGGAAHLYLRNVYSPSATYGWSTLMMSLTPLPGGQVSFGAEHNMDVPFVLFPADANGYPTVQAEPFSSWVEETYIYDGRNGNSSSLISRYSDFDISGDLGPPTPLKASIFGGSIVEGDRGSRNLSLRVELANTSSQPVSVSYRTFGGTAAVQSDYNATSGTLTFLPGETWKSIAVAIKSDRRREQNEYFIVELHSPVGATIEVGRAYATIVNDD